MTLSEKNPLSAAARIVQDWKDTRRDPLLVAVTIVLILSLIMIVVGSAFAGIGLMLHLTTGQVISHPLGDPAWNPVGSLICALVALAIIAGGITDVLQVVLTVAQKNAFDPANAKRIERLAWRVLELQVLAVMAKGLGLTVGGTVNGIDIAIGTGGNNIAFALVLFVLARVFRHGNALQEDVEGTV